MDFFSECALSHSGVSRSETRSYVQAQRPGQSNADWWREIQVDAPGRHVVPAMTRAVIAWVQGHDGESNAWMNEAYRYARMAAHMANELTVVIDPLPVHTKALQAPGAYL